MSAKNENLIVPVCKRALVIGISDYKEWRKKVPTIKDLTFSNNDAKEVTKLLKQFGYDVTSNCGQETTNASLVKDTIDEWLKAAKVNYDNGQYSHFFVYFSGHGVLSSDKGETCGVDSFGNLIPWDTYAKQFSQKSKTLAFFFLDQCRQKPPPTVMNQEKSYPIFNNTMKTGISVVKYCCAAGQLTTNDTTAGKTLSTQTENFIGKLSKAFTRTHDCIDSFNVNLEWAMPKQEWGDWVLFKDTSGELPASNFIPISDEDLNKKIKDLIWADDEDYKKGHIKVKDSHFEYMYAEAKKETEVFYHEENGSLGLGLTIMTLGIMAALPQSSDQQFKLKPNYPPHAEKFLVEELKAEDVGPQDYSERIISVRNEATEDPTFNSRITFAAARPLQGAAFARYKVHYTSTYRVPKDIFRAKALKELEKEQEAKKKK